MVLVDQNIAEACLASLHVDDGLVSVRHGALLDKWLDLVLGGKLEHLADGLGAADGGAGEAAAAGDEGEDGQRDWLLGGADLDHAAVEGKRLDVLADGHLGRRDGRDDDVEAARVVLAPLLVIVGRNVVVAAERQGLVALRRLTRDADDLVGAHGLGEDDGKVAEAADARDAHLLARADAPVLERRVDGHAAAEHRRRILGRQPVGDLDHKVRRRAVVQRVAAVRLVAVVVDRAVRVDVAVDAVRLLVLLARRALLLAAAEARVGLRADADNVTDLDAALGLGTDADGGTDDFVTDDARVGSSALEKKMD